MVIRYDEWQSEEGPTIAYDCIPISQEYEAFECNSKDQECQTELSTVNNLVDKECQTTLSEPPTRRIIFEDEPRYREYENEIILNEIEWALIDGGRYDYYNEGQRCSLDIKPISYYLYSRFTNNMIICKCHHKLSKEYHFLHHTQLMQNPKDITNDIIMLISNKSRVNSQGFIINTNIRNMMFDYIYEYIKNPHDWLCSGEYTPEHFNKYKINK